ncbi:hypothetical protein [Streptomyces mirabilis]|uniref:hypothetical protein n=1 Tax=Streptomyces mirabilis TaxID=68239 RepID=UPI0036DD1B1F
MTGTVIAIAAGIAGLWFQAVATYWSQQTSRDQLQQSREDSERKEREQASRVNFWRGGRNPHGNGNDPRRQSLAGSHHVGVPGPDGHGRSP